MNARVLVEQIPCILVCAKSAQSWSIPNGVDRHLIRVWELFAGKSRIFEEPNPHTTTTTTTIEQQYQQP
jgi:hypothetical protein